MNKDELLKQKEVLQAELNKLEELIKQEDEPAYYVPKMDEVYFYIGNDGDILNSTWGTWYGAEVDTFRHELGNCYKTYTDAKYARDIQKDLVRLQRLALTLNKGEKIDWKNTKQTKYGIVYDHYIECVRQNYCYTIQDNNIYCLSDKYLEEAIKLFGKDRLKEILTYQKILERSKLV